VNKPVNKPAVFKRGGWWICRKHGLTHRDTRHRSWEEAIGYALGGPRLTGNRNDYTSVV
jgi:hypothetical protein